MRTVCQGLSLAACLLLVAHNAAAADGRFDAVTIYGGVSNMEIEPANPNNTAVDSDGSVFGINARKSLIGPLFVESSYQFADYDRYNSGNFVVDQELTRYAVGVGAHSDEDARWIGYWRMDYTGLEFAVTEPDGDDDTEDGFAFNAGVILSAASWCDLNVGAAFLGLDELNGADLSAGVEFNVVPEVTLGGSLRFTALEDDAGNEIRLFTPVLRASYRFGGQPLFGRR